MSEKIVHNETDFWSKVDVRGIDECWQWQGCIEHGYGTYGKGKYQRAHQISLMLTEPRKDTDPPLALHDCDNPPCCNPNHLYWGTDADNVRDKKDRGRQHIASGTKNGHAKLNDSKVLRIRTICAQPNRPTYREVASIFGISIPTICDIVKRRSWKHI